MRIICAVDGSRYSNWALDYLLKMPLAKSPRITVLHVVDLAALSQPTFLAPSVALHYSRLMEEETRKSIKAGEKIIQKAAERLKGRWEHVRTVLERGHVAEHIIACSEREKADLIVMGSRGLRNISGFLLGSVSQKVSTYAACSVLIVKRRVRQVRKILLAVDGSAYSKRAVVFLARHFQSKGPLVNVTHVWDYPFSPPRNQILQIQKGVGKTLGQAGFR